MIQAEKLTKSFASHPLFRDLSFSFPNQGFVSVFGGNGSGKTTLLFLLAFFDKNYGGSLLYEGKEVRKMSLLEKQEIRHQDILYLAPGGNFLSFNTLRETVHLLDAEEEGPFQERFPSELSGGELQRAGLSLATSKSKKVILIDEGIAYLDEKKSQEALGYLHEIAKEKLIVFASPRALKTKADILLNMEDYDVKD